MIKKIFANKSKWSACAVWFLSLYLCFCAAGTREPRVTSFDVLGYYLYLPQTFIERDPGNRELQALQNANTGYNLTPTLYQVHPAGEGYHLSQYPIGMACFYLPGFITGHLVAKTLGYAADGYSAPYQYSQVYLNVIYCIIAFWILRKVLIRYFPDGITALLLLTIFFGTNFYVYATTGHGMPHTYLFLAYVLVLWLTIRWHEKPGYKNSLALGFIFGLMTVSRPTEIIAALIPLLWQVYSFKALAHKIKQLFTRHLRYVLACIFAFALLPALQVLYWKIYAGEFFHYSYANPGEGFEFLHPHLFEFLFSFRKGWFVYTPVMLLAVVFLFLGRHRHKDFWFPFVVFTCINIFILSCWSNWWYATSFGQRALIQTYPLYIFGLGLLLERVKPSKKIFAVSLTVVFLCCVLNMFQIWQLKHGILDLSRMTKAYYFAIFGKTYQPPGSDSLLLVDRTYSITDVLPHPERYRVTKEIKAEPDSAGMFSIGNNEAFGKKLFRLPYNGLTKADHIWIEISAELYTLDSAKRTGLNLSACFLNKSNQAYNWFATNVYEKSSPIGNGWARMTIYYLSPELRLTSDSFNCQFDNTNGGRYLVRNFKLRIFEPRLPR